MPNTHNKGRNVIECLGQNICDTRLKVHSHMASPNNQSLSYKPGKALSVIAEAPGYPNAPKRTCFGDFRVGLG